MSNIIQIKVGKMDNFMYIISLSDSLIVIDPSWGFEKIKEYSLNTSKKLSAVLLTHGHFDHINDIDKISQSFNKPDIYISSKDVHLIDFNYNFKFTDERDFIDIDDINIKIIKTPGHTPGSVCYLFENNLFTGDTLFSGACGRVDLPGSDPEEMRKSLLKLSMLNDDITVWPGHDYNDSKTTIGKEKKNNIYIKTAAFKDEFFSIVL